MAASELAYYHGGDPSKPVVYEDFLPASAAGSSDPTSIPTLPRPPRSIIRSTASIGWPVRSDTTFPYELYEKVASS
jgi:hypothetical protein